MCAFLVLIFASHGSAEILQGWPPGVPAVVCHMPCWPLGYVTVWVALVGFIALLRSYMSVGTAVLALGVRCGTFWGSTFSPFLVAFGSSMSVCSHALHKGQRALLPTLVRSYIAARTSLCRAITVAGEGSLRYAILRIAALRPSSVALGASGLGKLLTSKWLGGLLEASLHTLVKSTVAKWKLAVRRNSQSSTAGTEVVQGVPSCDCPRGQGLC